jgi:protein-L-isoaspartate(D-aspartate) O-methyltransferase
MSCPECGFDLPAERPCGVCGYDARLDLAAPGRPRADFVAPLLYSILVLILAAALSLPLLLGEGSQSPDVVAKARASSQESAPARAAEQEDPAPGRQPAIEKPSVEKPRVEQPPLDKPPVEKPPTKKPTAGTPAPNKPAPNQLSENTPRAEPDSHPAYAQGVVLAEETGAFDIEARDLHPPLSDCESYVAWMSARTGQQEKYLRARWDRAQAILSAGSILNSRILEAFLLTPREEFCRTPRRAYDNAAMPIGYGQTISGPHLVSRMTDALNPEPWQSVLEIGTGSGYQSALLSELTDSVYTIEIVEPLARETDAIYRRLQDRMPEYRNVARRIDDGYYGWEDHAPFDRIIVTCGIDHIPPELLRQLAPEGIMVIPVGPPSGQTILRVVKHVDPDGEVRLDREDIFHGKRKEIFVPFTSSGGGVHRGDQ